MNTTGRTTLLTQGTAASAAFMALHHHPPSFFSTSALAAFEPAGSEQLCRDVLTRYAPSCKTPVVLSHRPATAAPTTSAHRGAAKPTVLPMAERMAQRLPAATPHSVLTVALSIKPPSHAYQPPGGAVTPGSSISQQPTSGAHPLVGAVNPRGTYGGAYGGTYRGTYGGAYGGAAPAQQTRGGDQAHGNRPELRIKRGQGPRQRNLSKLPERFLPSLSFLEQHSHPPSRVSLNGGSSLHTSRLAMSRARRDTQSAPALH